MIFRVFQVCAVHSAILFKVSMTNTRNYSMVVGEKRHGFNLLTLDLSIAIIANLATSASMLSFRQFNEMTWPQSAICTFEMSRSFPTVPLQAAPFRLSMSRSIQFMSCHFLQTSNSVSTISGPPLDRPFMSGLLDRSSSVSSYVGLQPSVTPLVLCARLAPRLSLRELCRAGSRVLKI